MDVHMWISSNDAKYLRVLYHLFEHKIAIVYTANHANKNQLF